MPIYEYQCKTCDAIFDCVIIKKDDNFIPQCRQCGSINVKKLVSRVRYLAGPKESSLASSTSRRLFKSLGGKIADSTAREISNTAKEAAKRGKRRFEKMMDTGKSGSEDY